MITSAASLATFLPKAIQSQAKHYTKQLDEKAISKAVAKSDSLINTFSKSSHFFTTIVLPKRYPGQNDHGSEVTMEEIVYEYDGLASAPLRIDAVYKGGTQNNVKAEPIHILLPKTGNQGGFRPAFLDAKTLKCAYIVIYTTGNELEWPDYLDSETGIFRYYGDNQKPGSELHETRRKGNLLLKAIFEKLHTGKQSEIPPIFLFKKCAKGWDRRFLGLAAPGSQHISPDRDLVAFWRSMDGRRFQNYEAYFTILDLGTELISREWIDALLDGDPDSIQLAPNVEKGLCSLGETASAHYKPLES